jgi:hypothetical protein
MGKKYRQLNDNIYVWEYIIMAKRSIEEKITARWYDRVKYRFVYGTKKGANKKKYLLYIY